VLVVVVEVVVRLAAILAPLLVVGALANSVVTLPWRMALNVAATAVVVVRVHHVDATIFAGRALLPGRLALRLAGRGVAVVAVLIVLARLIASAAVLPVLLEPIIRSAVVVAPFLPSIAAGPGLTTLALLIILALGEG
jgi:hypothetical protein